eukprot:2124410-Pleurochrysis_carterae.AAC.2
MQPIFHDHVLCGHPFGAFNIDSLWVCASTSCACRSHRSHLDLRRSALACAVPAEPQNVDQHIFGRHEASKGYSDL